MVVRRAVPVTPVIQICCSVALVVRLAGALGVQVSYHGLVLLVLLRALFMRTDSSLSIVVELMDWPTVGRHDNRSELSTCRNIPARVAAASNTMQDARDDVRRMLEMGAMDVK